MRSGPTFLQLLALIGALGFIIVFFGGACGVFGSNAQQLVVDLCESFTSQRVYIVNHR